MWSRIELKTRAKAVLKINYWKALLVSFLITLAGGNPGGIPFSSNFRSSTQTRDLPGSFVDSSGDFFPYLIVFIILGVIIFSLVVLALRIFVGYPLEVGGRRYFILSAESNYELNTLGYGFSKPKYFNIIKSMLLRDIFNFLWYLVLIIPGVIKFYSYSMVPYILSDNPNIGPKRAIELSRQMTNGHKFNMFILDVSFIGWYLLGLLLFFIGIFFVLPYVNATKAELYLVLRKNALEHSLCSNEELLLNCK